MPKHYTMSMFSKYTAKGQNHETYESPYTKIHAEVYTATRRPRKGKKLTAKVSRGTVLRNFLKFGLLCHAFFYHKWMLKVLGSVPLNPIRFMYGSFAYIYHRF